VPSPLLHSVAFVGGFTAVFVSFGVSLGLLGFFLRDHQDTVLKVSGTLLIIMGLHLSGVITIPFLEQERRFDVGQKSKVGYVRSFFVGAAFSAGWSPCIGPTLGAIFARRLQRHGARAAYSSWPIRRPLDPSSWPRLNGVKPVYNRIKRYVGVINYLSGATLIIVGILIFTNSLINMNELFNFGFLPEVSNT
jgi:cytochrome c-type biogenesis protein